jgi:hypothetical protein
MVPAGRATRLLAIENVAKGRISYGDNDSDTDGSLVGLSA